MEREGSRLSFPADSAGDAFGNINSTYNNSGPKPTRSGGNSPEACLDKPGENFEDMTQSGAVSEGWVHPNSNSNLGKQKGVSGTIYPKTSGEFASLPSQSNSTSKVILWEQGQDSDATADFAAALQSEAEDIGSSWDVLNTLKREVFATSALLRALRTHALSQTRGVSAASRQQLAAAVAPLIKSFEMLTERLAAAEAAKEPPPAELQEQHIHPFLFVLAQQQLQHKQQQGLNKQQQLLHQSCMRALASAVLRSLDQLLTVGLLRCRSTAGRRCVHALILSLRNCALQAAQRLHSAPTQSSVASATASGAFALGSEAYGGVYYAPTSPAAEEELLLLQCLDLLSNSLLGPSGHLLSDACVTGTIQCCVAVSLLHRASPLLRNAATSRAVAIIRHLFALENLKTLFSQQEKQHQEEGSPRKQSGNTHDQQQSLQAQHASTPPQFVARLESAMSLRSTGTTYFPKCYGLESRLRILALISGLLSHDETRITANNSSGNASNGSACCTGGGRTTITLPPFVPLPASGSPHAASEGTGEDRGDSAGKQDKLEEGSHDLDTSAVSAASTGTTQPASVPGTRDRASRNGASGAIDREFEILLGHRGRDKASMLETRVLSLRLLCVILEAGRGSISSFPSLLQPLQAQILPLVLQQDPRSAPLMLLSLTLRVVGDFISFFRSCIKDDMERCLYLLLRLSTANCGGPSKTTLAAEAQELALDTLRELCSDSSFGFELMLNYDGDIRRSNMFAALLTLLLQLAAPRVPTLRGAYRFTEGDIEGFGQQGSPNYSLSHACMGTGLSCSDVLPAKTPTQQLSPSGSSPSSVSTSLVPESGRAHHHSAFHLRKAPPRSPLKSSRSTAESGVATSTENVATDAAGVARPAGLSNVNRLALAAVLRLISALDSRCDNLNRRNAAEHQQQQSTELEAPKARLANESAAEYFLRIQAALPLGQRRKHKALLSYGAALFNSNTKEAIPQLEGLGLLPTPATPRSTALFLKETRGLDLRAVGLYLSTNKPWNAAVLREFVALFTFGGVGLVAALREFLKTFRLPGESQQIERVMEAFADEFFRQQPLVNCPHNKEKLAETTADDSTTAAATADAESLGPGDANANKRSTAVAEPVELSLWRWVVDEGLYSSTRAAAAREGAADEDQQTDTSELTKQLSEFSPAQPPPGYVLMVHKDTVFVLSYSIIMLNTDQHNNQVRGKMKVEDFVKNNRGINNGSDLPSFYLQNIYISIRHQEIKLKETALATSPPSQAGQAQKGDAATKEQQQQQPPDIFDILADGWTPAEGAGLGWGAFASPYGGALGFKSQECATAYRSVPKLRTAPAADSCSNNGCARSNAGAEILAEEGLEAEMFQCMWNSGCFSVLRGAFESSLDLRQLEEILCGFVSLARAATALGQVVALNVIVAELCSYFVYTVPAHSQLILAPVMYLIRCSGASLREEGWGAILELLLRLHALDLLPPALMNLDDFEGSGGAALPSLCTLLPPQFTPPVSRRDRGAGRKGGGWLGDLTSILFALGDSDDESDGDDNSGAHGQMVALSEELNFACDGLYVLRASTDFALLPSTLAVPVASCPETEAERGVSELRQMPRPPRYQGDARAGSHTSGAEQQLQRGHAELLQHEQQIQQQENAAARSPSSAPAEDEEFASAKVPYLRLKTVLSQGIHVDAAVAEVLRQIEPISSLSAAVVLLLHIVSGFPPIRQNPGVPPDCPSQSQLLQQQLHPASAVAASQNRSSGEAPSRVAGPSSGTLTTVTSSASSGTPNHSPSPLQAPEDLGLPCSPGVEQSMLSTYLLDTQRRGVDVDTSRPNSGSISSASCASVGSTATSTQGSGTLPYSLPPPVWSPLRGCVTPQLLTYRAYTDRLFCLELLGALMLSELTPGSLSLHRSKPYGNALLQSSPWLLCAVYLDTFLRRYSIGTAASGVPTPLEVVGLADSTEQRQQQQQQPLSGAAGMHADRPLWARAVLDACSKDPLAQATMRSVCNVFQAIGSRRLVDTPTSLPHWELLFIERLVVTVLRICLRLLSDEDSLLLPVYTKTRTTQPADTDLAGCTAASQVAIHHLQLLTLLHPNVFCMHVQRICQSAIILVSRLNLRACSSPLLIQVLLALYQRLVPLPAFQPTAPLPQQLTQPQPQQLARKIIASLSDWVKDSEALALLILQHRNHYQMLLQTLMALCIYVPPFPPAQAAASSPSEARIEGDAHDKQQPQQSMSSASSYEANCSSLTLLASLIPSVGEALRSKGGAVSACLAAAANAAFAESTGGCATWKARLDCQAMWLQSMQVLAIVCSFSARPVKVKALAILQQVLIRCSRNQPGQAESTAVTVQETPGHSRGRNEASQSMVTPATGDAVSVAAAAVDYWTRAAEDPYTWRLCLQLVVFPLLSLRFDYPYTPPPPGDAPPPPPQLQHHHNGVNTGDSMFTLPAEHDPLQHQRDLQAGMPWMALPTRRRLTPEAAIATLGLDEVYQRKAAAASLACRLFLTKMELLLQPFKVKGFYVDFVAGQLPSAEVSRFQGPSGDHPGGIEGLLPPLTQLVQLLVTEAKQAPVVYRDAFLESMKNTLLVVLTCPFVAASPIPSDLKTPISPASVLPVIFVPKQQQQQQLQRQPDMSGTETQEAQASDEAAQGPSTEEALLRMLSFLTDSQRLVVSAVSPFVVSTFPKVVQELLLILPTPQPSSTHPVLAHQEASDEHRGNSGTAGAPDNVGDSSPGSFIDSGNEKCTTTKEHVVDVGNRSATSVATADGSAGASL